MQILLIVVSILLIAIVLLQGSKSGGDANIMSGGNSDLFSNRKERGGELFITRLTFCLGIAYLAICIIINIS